MATQGAGSGTALTSSASPSFKGRFVFNGLGTLSVTIPLSPTTTSPHFVKVKSIIPTLVNGGGASSLLITINQNGSPVYVGQVGAMGAYVDLNISNDDVIAVVFSSANPNDTGLNVLKSTIDIGGGQ